MPVTNLTHGHARRRKQTGAYTSWRAMVSRCRNPKTEKWAYYGGRGIKVCGGWQDFATFLADLGERPPRHSIDRVDPNGHYSCGHCSECIANDWHANGRWRTQSEQCLNRRPRSLGSRGGRNASLSRAFAIHIAGVTTTLSHAAIAEMFGVSVSAVEFIKYGKTYGGALTWR